MFLGFFFNCKPLFGSEQILLLLLLLLLLFFFFFTMTEFILCLWSVVTHLESVGTFIVECEDDYEYDFEVLSTCTLKIFALQTLSTWLRTKNFCTHRRLCNPIWRLLMRCRQLFLLVCLHTLTIEIMICIKNLWDKFSRMSTEFERPFFLSISENAAYRLKFIRVFLTQEQGNITCYWEVRNDSMPIKKCYCIVF